MVEWEVARDAAGTTRHGCGKPVELLHMAGRHVMHPKHRVPAPEKSEHIPTDCKVLYLPWISFHIADDPLTMVLRPFEGGRPEIIMEGGIPPRQPGQL